MRAAVYRREDIQAWEQRWFATGNSSFGLMQQAAWQMAQRIVVQLDALQDADPSLAQLKPVSLPMIGVWCGAGNNGGDGYLVAVYLQQAGFNVWVLQVEQPNNIVAQQALDVARQDAVPIYKYSQTADGKAKYGEAAALPMSVMDIDALFGVGLNREIGGMYAEVIQYFNQRATYKVALDIPSGIAADSGTVMGVAVKADLTLTVLGLKAGLFTGQGAAYSRQVQCLALIPPDSALSIWGHVDETPPQLPVRVKTAHKGNNGHVLIVGGDEDMGGAAIMAAEAALAAGAGKVTLLTHQKHHAAALTRCPNMMTLSMPALAEITPEFVRHICHAKTVVAIGMGLGRGAWGRQVWEAFLPVLQDQAALSRVVVDADGLYHLAAWEMSLAQPHWYISPHSGEAARLLNCSVAEVEQDRISAVYALSKRYALHSLLKGAGSLSVDDGQLSICALGNAGMGTAGMGDILSGMLGGLLAQYPDLPMNAVVALHAHAGDVLAQTGQRGIQATDMLAVIKQVVN